MLLYIKFVGGIPALRTGQRIRRVFDDSVSDINQLRPVETQHHLPFLEKLGAAMVPSSTGKQDKIRKKLKVAGFRRKKHIINYYLLKCCCVMAAAVIGLSLYLAGLTSAIYVIAFSILFLFLPDIVLPILIRRRLQKITMALPDFIDLCNVSMTAGLGWLSSVKKVIGEFEKIHPEICLEFTHLFDQIQTGMDRVEAYNQLAARNPTPEIQYLANVLIQNEKMGSSISNSLADLSKRIYDMRQLAIEEKTAKLPVKLVFITTVFFFLPYLLILMGEPLLHVGRLLGR
ncbi:MAG: type II secretion system F family protein [Thermodesulfobacteriota bacterium]